jgi:hypothetical protein
MKIFFIGLSNYYNRFLLKVIEISTQSIYNDTGNEQVHITSHKLRKLFFFKYVSPLLH